jgi:P-type E1-E2 ATPase
VILVDLKLAALLVFQDKLRPMGSEFVAHLERDHGFRPSMIISGDRPGEVAELARAVGIREYLASQTPEQKLERIRKEAREGGVIYVGDGINDAPALLAATVGIAFGLHNEITAEASGVTILDTKLEKLNEFLHISRNLRKIALQSAVGGMLISVLAIVFAAGGYLTPLQGAILQEFIDLAAVLNALRTTLLPRHALTLEHL